jgi:hypothetical protein
MPSRKTRTIYIRFRAQRSHLQSIADRSKQLRASADRHFGKARAGDSLLSIFKEQTLEYRVIAPL